MIDACFVILDTNVLTASNTCKNLLHILQVTVKLNGFVFVFIPIKIHHSLRDNKRIKEVLKVIIFNEFELFVPFSEH